MDVSLIRTPSHLIRLIDDTLSYVLTELAKVEDESINSFIHVFQSQVIKNIQKTILIDACCQTSDIESRSSSHRKISTAGSRSSSHERRRRLPADHISRRSRSEGRLLKVRSSSIF